MNKEQVIKEILTQLDKKILQETLIEIKRTKN
jgi:hypothetical protein